MRWLLFVCLLVICGCDGESGSSDAGSTRDAGLDAGAALDAGAPRDAGTDASGSDASAGDASADASIDASDAGGAIDAGSCAPGSAIPDRVAGVCDGRGRMACAMWAEMHGGPGAVAQCTPPMGRCARADACSAAGCTCGGGPECEDDEMCVPGAGGAYACACITP